MSSGRDFSNLFPQSDKNYWPREVMDHKNVAEHSHFPQAQAEGLMADRTAAERLLPTERSRVRLSEAPVSQDTAHKTAWPEPEPSHSKLDTWETPTSLISRLTAGLTNTQDSGGGRNCPSPSNSECSETSSFFSHREPYRYEDPFQMAHQELMDEAPKLDPKPVPPKAPKGQDKRQRDEADKRTRAQSHTSNDSFFSDTYQGDSNTFQSQDSDTEDDFAANYLTADGHLPDIDFLLSSIKDPDLIPHVPDKLAIHKYLEPHEVGHINHLIKSLSDAMLNISLPDTLYKNKGFTPLDFIDVHLNSVIRHFFFVFKNEDFLNIKLADQVTLLEGCSLRAVCCSGLYLFNKESGCWYIPGATGMFSHPVMHISDLLQVYPKQFVSRTFELHNIAAKLNFDWPMGVISQCIIMYTPIDKVISEAEKVEVLRNKYVSLLLKYVTWKHGAYNASQIFPEVLKVLDAIILLVEELSTVKLNLKSEEVVAIEERLSTLTVTQLGGFESGSKDSWPSMEYVTLGEVQQRLCRAMHVSMLESLHSNASDWAESKVMFTSSLMDEPPYLTGREPLAIEDKRPAKTSARGIMVEQESLAEKDLVLLRRFLEDVTGKENSMILKGLKEKMDTGLIKLICDKLCS